MRKILIIRFGALGDLCLLGWSISRLARSPHGADLKVTLVTKAAFAPLMEKMHGIDRVIPFPEGGLGELIKLAAQLRSENFDSIVDGHNVLRSNLLLMLMGQRPTSSLKKDTAARLALLGFNKSHHSLNQTMGDRFDALFDHQSADESPPLMHLRSNTGVSFPTLGLAPGAQWDSKRWPEGHFAELLDSFCTQNPSPVRIFLGPREEIWFPGSKLEAVCTRHSKVEIIRGKNLTQVASLLAQCNLVITNDSGLLHMSEAVGTPVLAFYGPTVAQFGYFPRLPRSEVMEVTLECRPCSRNGKKACHRGDLACLQNIHPTDAAKTLFRIWEDREPSS